MSLTHVSLFSGVGGFDLAASEAGIPTLAACEIDKAARGVLADRFPNVHIYLDVKEVTGDSLRNLGADPRRTVLTAGWPCQGNSVAGRRGGMADERSGLWHEVARVLAEFRPAWFVGENVPGLLTVNSGRDMETVLDDLNNLGYLVDWNIYDAQYFGVPQRRRRVVFTCQLVDASLQARTPWSFCRRGTQAHRRHGTLPHAAQMDFGRGSSSTGWSVRWTTYARSGYRTCSPRQRGQQQSPPTRTFSVAYKAGTHPRRARHRRIRRWPLHP